jgi:hypothetical protein
MDGEIAPQGHIYLRITEATSVVARSVSVHARRQLCEGGKVDDSPPWVLRAIEVEWLAWNLG